MPESRAVFISGGGSGVGQALAMHFAGQGWQVGIGDINSIGLSETKALLRGGSCFEIILDVRLRNNWDHALSSFRSYAKCPISVVINNAGIGTGGDIIDLSDEDVERMIAVNILGVVNGARAAFSFLAEARPAGCLLNIASASALYGIPGSALYSATKFAVRGLTEALDLEWEASGIKVRSLMPDYIDTPLLAEPASTAGDMTKRERVMAAGLAFTSVEDVTRAAYEAVNGRTLHTIIGRSAKTMALAARFAPRLVRIHLRTLLKARLGQ